MTTAPALTARPAATRTSAAAATPARQSAPAATSARSTELEQVDPLTLYPQTAEHDATTQAVAERFLAEVA